MKNRQYISVDEIRNSKDFSLLNFLSKRVVISQRIKGCCTTMAFWGFLVIIASASAAASVEILFSLLQKKATTGASIEERLSSLEARDFDGCSRVVSGESKSRGQGRPRRSSTTRPRRPPRTSTDFCSYSQLLLSHHFLLIGRSLIATRIWVPIMTFGAKSCYVNCSFIMDWIPELLPGKAVKKYYNKMELQFVDLI